MKFERISSFCFTLVLLLFHFDDVEFADVTLYKGRNCWQASWLLSILFIFHFLFRIIIIPSISSFGLFNILLCQNLLHSLLYGIGFAEHVVEAPMVTFGTLNRYFVSEV